MDKKLKSTFSSEKLNDIFKLSAKHQKRLASRESSWLEFKQSFSWGAASKYARTLAAFANAKGGYIVFGVKNSPHTIVGLKDDRFETTDPEKTTAFLNEHFAPELRWDMHIYEFAGLQFGLLHVSESNQKPVICTKNAPELKEGEIYYRYRGRSQLIRYPELRQILDEARDIERKLWLQHLSRIARIGVKDAAIFNPHTGKVTGSTGTFVIDESLLDKLSFIREGEFNEKKGTPALKLV